MARESIILFGEGKSEAIFLSHLKKVYSSQIQAKVKVDKGQGKTPRDIIDRLINKHLKVGSYDKALVLLDSDVPHKIPKKILVENNIDLALSTPQCLEGMLLSILGLSPKGAKHASSSSLKSTFMKHLGTQEDRYMIKFHQKCPDLFPKTLLESKRLVIPQLDVILKFLGI
jgi:hypothetical protein